MSHSTLRNPYSQSPARSQYRHDPYGATVIVPVTMPTFVESDSVADFNNSTGSRGESPAAGATMQHVDFESTLHKALMGQVNFEPFPQFSNHAAPMLHFTKAQCCRLFIGQIPYGSPAAQVEWMVFAATGRRVYFTETIQRWTGSRSPKGCAHTYCRWEDRDAIIAMLHRRVLVDDTGVWIAADDAQSAELEEYCTRMRTDKSLRFRDRPYQPMVVEEATSDFVPRRASPPPQGACADATNNHLPILPPMYDQFVHIQTFAAPELPQYEDFYPPPQYDTFALNC